MVDEQQALELGGRRHYFTGDLEQYEWSRAMGEQLPGCPEPSGAVDAVFDHSVRQALQAFLLGLGVEEIEGNERQGVGGGPVVAAPVVDHSLRVIDVKYGPYRLLCFRVAGIGAGPDGMVLWGDLKR